MDLNIKCHNDDFKGVNIDLIISIATPIYPSARISILRCKELSQEESLKQNNHKNMDIFTFVLSGQLRQDSNGQENVIIKENEFSLLHTSDSDETNWHKESNSGLEKLKFIQIFISSDVNQEYLIQQFRNDIDKNKMIKQAKNYQIEYKIIDESQNLQNDDKNITVIVCINGKIRFNILEKQMGDRQFVLDTSDLVIIKEICAIQIDPIINSQLIVIKID